MENSLTGCSLAMLMVALLSGCATSAPLQASPVLADFRVLEHGQDQGGEFCADFRLTAAQAKRYFDRATILSPSRQHDDFDELPCWVRGSARGTGGIWQWEVRAGGTARVVAPDGAATQLGCAVCASEMGAQAESSEQDMRQSSPRQRLP